VCVFVRRVDVDVDVDVCRLDIWFAMCFCVVATRFENWSCSWSARTIASDSLLRGKIPNYHKTEWVLHSLVETMDSSKIPEAQTLMLMMLMMLMICWVVYNCIFVVFWK
jgi:hypothetical protein